MLKEGYRWLRRGEKKREGDQLCCLSGADEPNCAGWVNVYSELGTPVTKGDLSSAKYRRPLKSAVAARSASTNSAMDKIAAIADTIIEGCFQVDGNELGLLQVNKLRQLRQ